MVYKINWPLTFPDPFYLHVDISGLERPQRVRLGDDATHLRRSLIPAQQT